MKAQSPALYLEMDRDVQNEGKTQCPMAGENLSHVSLHVFLPREDDPPAAPLHQQQWVGAAQPTCTLLPAPSPAAGPQPPPRCGAEALPRPGKGQRKF